MDPPKISLMLIPGLLSNETAWKHQIQNLQDIASVRVISTTRESTPDHMVSALLSQAPAKFALAGHSMGGWLALEIMRRAPERVVKLCLLNTTARSDSTAKQARRKNMIEEVQKGKFLTIADQIADSFIYNKAIKPKVLKMFLEVGEAAFICQETGMVLRESCLPLLSSIRIPTWVLYAEKDQNFSLIDHEELASNIPEAKLQIIPDSGHMSPMEAPETVTALLRQWLCAESWIF